MSKKKRQKEVIPQLSPEKYILTKVKSLPIVRCVVNSYWQEAGGASIIVARQHKSGNYTIGVYHVDTLCLGVKDAAYYFSLHPSEYERIEEGFEEIFRMEDTSYEEVHNIIYGAIAYAEELGFKPAKKFSIAKHILEEDTEDIPLIEYEFGRAGMPFLIVKSELEGSKYLPTLRKNVGEGNFGYLVADEEEEDDDDYFDYDHTSKYHYDYPDYPDVLTYKHKELDALFDPDNAYDLNPETVNKILAINRSELLDDLENILLYEMGRTCGHIPIRYWEAPEISAVIHALLLFAELHATEKFDVVLEILRQNDEFRNFHFNDFPNLVLPMTLYYTVGDQSERLLKYMQEPSLDDLTRASVPEAMAYIAINSPERREEVIEWFRSLLSFYMGEIDGSKFFDPALIGFIVDQLVAIKAVELLPEVENLFSTDLVDTGRCGSYDEVKEKIKIGVEELSQYKLVNIFERYHEMKKLIL